MSNAHARPVLHKPASGRFILATLVLALLGNLLPWNETAKLVWPDFVALLLIHWIIYQPRHVGLFAAFMLGLLMDIADGALLGQHALAYVLMAYLTQLLHRRLQMFLPWQQALYVFALLCASLLFMLAVRLLVGAAFPGGLYFASSVVGAALWPLLVVAMQLPQRRRAGTTPA